MKKIFLYLLLCFAFLKVSAQKGVIFKIKYQPQHTYQSTTNLTLKLIANLNGNKKITDMLNAQGIKQPINADMAISINGNTKSGVAAADNSFPLTIDYQVGDISIKSNGKEFPIPISKNKDKKIYGHVTQDGQLKIDSAEGKKVNDTTDKKLQQMMGMVHSHIKFPEKPLNPGDTFTQGTPFNIPMKGMEDAKIDINVTYKLISITDGKAYFDLMQNLNVNLKTKKGDVTVSGTGAGKMVYSIKDNFPVSLSSTLNIKMNASMDTTVVNGTAIVNTDQVTTIN